VWDSRREETYNTFSEWLNIIKLLGKNSPVAIVQNKVDEREDEIEQKMFKEKFGNVSGFFKVSCETNQGIDLLKAHIQSGLEQLPHIGHLLPSVWVEIRDQLEQINEDFIEYQRYLDICESYSLDKDEADTLVEYLHDLGSIVHFSEDYLLKNMVILKPEWATQAVYLLVDNAEAKKSYGKLHYDKIESIWNQSHYFGRHPELIQLLKRFEICFEIDQDNNKYYILPELLLPDSPDEFEWNQSNLVHLEYHYQDYMPTGVFTRLMVKLNSYIKGNIFWRNGLIIQKDGGRTTAYIKNSPLEATIIIEISGQDKPGFLSLIRMNLEEINDSLNGPKYSEMCGCICEECIKSDEREMYRLDQLQKGLSKNVFYLQCRKSFEQVNIKSILYGIEDLELFKEANKTTSQSVFDSSSYHTDILLAQNIELLRSFVQENGKNNDERAFLQSQINVIIEELASKEDKKQALKIIHAFFNKSVVDVSNSVVGGMIIELGKFLLVV
jgi:hypothetical protein